MTDPAGEPFLSYGRHLVEEDDIAAVAAVLRSDWLTTGPAVQAFENAVRARVGVLPRNSETSFIAPEIARLREAFVWPGSPVSASADAAITVACQVRKSLAVASMPKQVRM